MERPHSQRRSHARTSLLACSCSMIICYLALWVIPPAAVAAAATTRPFDPSAPAPNPNPPPPHVVKARNARRFPGEWFPEGYDVGEPATTGTATSETLWQSPAGMLAAHEPRVWFDHPRGTPRTPGKLLLNMLVRNEAENLARTLPRWAKVIDYWIIGVDVKNDDDSLEIIKKHLGHLPGEIALVKGFDGHGPTWTTLVTLGIKNYPGATHGIIADADFSPMRDTFDRWELDIRCSKHMYTIWTEDHRNERKMDWVYRNIPGARITRRTHQVVEVPQLPDQEVFQTLLNLPLDERAGGFGDRSGNKQERYIAWMAADLLDFPDDPRALYYLGYGHLDLYNTHGGTIEARHRESLQKSVEYFNRRVDLPAGVGNKEERWFALLKLAEIHERFLGEWPKAEAYYKRCIALDDQRADPPFYIGQHYRLVGDPVSAEPWLYSAASMSAPVRSLFMWYHLYHCLSKLEYGRNHLLRADPNLKQCKRTIRVLDSADCRDGDPGQAAEVARIRAKASEQLETIRAKRRLAKRRKEKQRQKAEKAAEAARARAEEAAATEEEETTEEHDSDATAASVAASSLSAIVRPLPRDQRYTPQELLSADRKLPASRAALRAGMALADAIDTAARSLVARAAPDSEAATALQHDLVSALSALSAYIADFDSAAAEADATRKKRQRCERAQAGFLTCSRMRKASYQWFRVVDQHNATMQRSVRSTARAPCTGAAARARAVPTPTAHCG